MQAVAAAAVNQTGHGTPGSDIVSAMSNLERRPAVARNDAPPASPAAACEKGRP
jgi:hypothetical protein